MNDVHCELLQFVLQKVDDVESDVIVHVVNLWCVDICEVNVELSKDDVHSSEGKVVVTVGIVEDDVIDVNVDVRVDAEVTKIVTLKFQCCVCVTL